MAIVDLWATQIGDGMTTLKITTILDALGLRDRNLAFVRELQNRLESAREDFYGKDGVSESLVDRFRRRRDQDRATQYQFRKTGDYWSIRFAGEFTTIKDAVGNRYIAELLSRPHQKIFAPELLAAVSGEATVGEAGSAGAQTDKQTLDEVKQKYLDIQRGLDEAERNNDMASQERLQKELDGLTDYLKSVKGFGGRTREASDDADKIRRAMTQAIGRVIDSLAADDKIPAAALHLKNALRTGRFMSYEPEEEIPWNL
ncbi:MAG: hypothetical protein WD468_00450 [Pirellulales bacterium]